MNGATYYLAQHVADVFRRENRNVGVIVLKGADKAAKFLGETDAGVVDGRKVRSFTRHSVYQHWVRYWRKLLDTAVDGIDLSKACGSNYVLLHGGLVANTGDDPAAEVAQFLYAMLVSDGGIPEALGAAEVGAVVTTSLKDEVVQALQAADLIALDESRILQVPHPVLRDVPIQGSLQEPHRPSFSQQNGRLYVIETVDFAQRKIIRDHAGFAAFMFGDLRTSRDAETIAVLRNTEAAIRQDATDTDRYAMAALTKTATKLVRWDVKGEREQFLEDRLAVARD